MVTSWKHRLMIRNTVGIVIGHKAWLCGWQCWSGRPLLWSRNISTTVGLIAMILSPEDKPKWHWWCLYLFPVVLPCGWYLWFCMKCPLLLYGLAWNLVQLFMFPSGLTFHLMPSWGQTFFSLIKKKKTCKSYAASAGLCFLLISNC